MKKINLKEEFDCKFNCYYGYNTPDEEPAMTYNRFKEVVKDIIEKVLELASENACGNHCTDYVDKESIKNTINQIKI